MAQLAEIKACLAATQAEHEARLAASEAEHEALLAASEADKVALRVALQASEAAQRPPAAAPRRAAPTFNGMRAALGPQSFIDSPSKASGASIVGRYAELSFCARPLTPALAGLSAAASLEEWRGKSAAELLREESAHPISTMHVPAWVEAITRKATASQGSQSAATLYLNRSSATAPRPAMPNVQVPWNCQPELLTRPRQPFHPAFCGEIKSALSKGDTKERPRMFDELTTYALLALLGSFFQGVPLNHHRFFHAPPLAYGLAAFAHVGYLVCVEWVGRLRVTVVSQPFFLGSPEHAAAVAALPDCNMSAAFVDLPVEGVEVAAWPEGEGSRHVLWRVSPPAAGREAGAAGASSEGGGASASRDGTGSSSSRTRASSSSSGPVAASSSSSKSGGGGARSSSSGGGGSDGGGSDGGGGGGGGGGGSEPPPASSDPRFFKILCSEGFSEAYFCSLHAVYSALAAARAGAGSSDPPPPALLPAELLYGAGEVCVLMPWVRGREARAEELGEGGCAVAPVACAIAWLARHGLLYIDVRLPNVLVEEGEGGQAARVRLVDYDDALCLGQPVACAEELCALLRQHSAFVQMGAYPALLAALMALPWP